MTRKNLVTFAKYDYCIQRTLSAKISACLRLQQTGKLRTTNCAVSFTFSIKLPTIRLPRSCSPAHPTSGRTPALPPPAHPPAAIPLGHMPTCPFIRPSTGPVNLSSTHPLAWRLPTNQHTRMPPASLKTAREPAHSHARPNPARQAVCSPYCGCQNSRQPVHVGVHPTSQHSVCSSALRLIQTSGCLVARSSTYPPLARSIWRLLVSLPASTPGCQPSLPTNNPTIIGETVVNTLFNAPFASMSVLLKDFVFAWLW